MRALRSELIKGHTPALILTVLTAGPLHGYGIARRIEALSEGLLSLNEGSLYPALHSLEHEGAVAASWATEKGRPRKCYTITAKGRRQLADLTREWADFAGAVDRVLGGAADA